MDFPLWGLAVLTLYPLLQIPAVLYLSQYCEVEWDDLRTPPMRAFWRARAGAPSEESDEDGRGTRGSTRKGLPESVVRCRRCGTTNATGYDRCRACVAPLRRG